MSELKPCPFCGGESFSFLHKGDDCERYGYVSCDYCTAGTKGKSLHWSDGADEELTTMSEAATAWNTRAVPDVPELVIVAYGVDESNKGKPLVRHDQAAEIFAAKDKEINKHKQNTAKVIREGLREVAHMRARAEAVEAKLAQYEAQEPVKGVALIDGQPALISRTKPLPKGAIPLYASPAPCPDLKAEIERLKEVLRKAHVSFEIDRTGRFEGLKNIINVALGDTNA